MRLESSRKESTIFVFNVLTVKIRHIGVRKMKKSSAVDTCSHPVGLVQILRVS